VAVSLSLGDHSLKDDAPRCLVLIPGGRQLLLLCLFARGEIGRITHVSYVSNTPPDRMRKYLEALVKSGLVEMRNSGDGTSYVMTPRAHDFLRAYVLVNSILIQKE
jgi:predicted transcriptional regulator